MSTHRTPHRLVALFNVRRDEIAPVLLAIFFFFCVLTALMVLRPARDALGMQRGIEAVRWLFIGTALVTLLVNPLFGWMVSRFRRLQFIAATYLFFAASLICFYLLLAFAPDAIGETSGQVFYVWFSVFNLFATMLFWALMADRFSLEQSKRFFALIAVGGTLGAIFGPWLASVLAKPLGTSALLLASSGFLVLALGAAWAVARSQPRQPATDSDSDQKTETRHNTPSSDVAYLRPDTAHASTPDGVHNAQTPLERTDNIATRPARDEHAVIGGSAWQGLKTVFRSRYLLGIAGYVIAMTIMATLLYFTRLQMVAALGDDMDLRTTLFARIDLITQIATLLLQAIFAGRLMKRFGVHVTLMLLPFTVVLGFIGLAIVGTLAALIVFEATFRAIQRALTRPARETLYTVVSREDKYKSKAFIDTFVYRGGDVAGAQIEGLIGRLGMGPAGLASVAIPLALIWAALGLWLGRAQQRIAADREAVSGRHADAPPNAPKHRY